VLAAGFHWLPESTCNFMAKSRRNSPRTATGKKASPVTRATAEQQSVAAYQERTEEGHRAAGREPAATGNLVSKGARAVRRSDPRMVDQSLRDRPMLTED